MLDRKSVTQPELRTAAPRIAVLVPCYNEEVAIAKVVRDFGSALPEAAIYVYECAGNIVGSPYSLLPCFVLAANFRASGSVQVPFEGQTSSPVNENRF